MNNNNNCMDQSMLYGSSEYISNHDDNHDDDYNYHNDTNEFF